MASETTLREQLRVAARNKPFRVSVFCFVAQSAGVAAMLAGVRYFADHVLHDRAAVALLFVCVVSPAILVMPCGTGSVRAWASCGVMSWPR